MLQTENIPSLQVNLVCKMRFPLAYLIASGVSKKGFFRVWHITTEAGEKTTAIPE